MEDGWVQSMPYEPAKQMGWQLCRAVPRNAGSNLISRPRTLTRERSLTRSVKAAFFPHSPISTNVDAFLILVQYYYY